MFGTSTRRDDLIAEFMPPADQSTEVADQPPQVINKDSPVVIADGDGGADEDDEVVKIDNPTSVLSSEDHPPNHLN